MKNRIRAELVKGRIRLGEDPWTRKGRLLLQALGLEAVYQVPLVLDALDRQRMVMSRDLRRMCGENPQVRLLTTIPEVGYYLACSSSRRSVTWGVSLTRRAFAAT